MRRFIPGTRFVALVAFLLVVAPIAVIAATGAFATRVAPQLSNISVKSQRADLMRSYGVTPDPSIDPMQAGEALRSIANRSNVVPAPMRRPLHARLELPSAGKGLFEGTAGRLWGGPAADRIVTMAHKGFSPAEMRYLAELAAAPGWEEYSTVAYASRMDEAGGMFVVPFPKAFSGFEMPVLQFGAIKEFAYANSARAAWHLANGRPAEAERTLRETISFGFRLADDGNTIIDHLIGIVVVGIGRSGLEQLYSVTNNPELARLQAATADFDSRPPHAFPASTGSALLERAIADSTMPRGLRLELTRMAAMSVCGNPRELMFGASPALNAALAASRKQFVRSSAEGAVFDLQIGVIDQPQAIPDVIASNAVARALVVVAQVPALLLHNPRLLNCAAFGGGLGNV